MILSQDPSKAKNCYRIRKIQNSGTEHLNRRQPGSQDPGKPGLYRKIIQI